MIQRLLINNYALIDELEIDFSKGLTIITGETGAGKSILLGALGLIMGNRADTKVFYHTDKKCIVEGFFEISRYGLREFFDEKDIDYDDEIVIRRELTPAGKSRAFVNDTPVKLKTLGQLTAAIIDLHQQFDTLDIHNVSFQMRMMDALAGNYPALEKYQLEYSTYQKNKRQLANLVDRNQSAATEIDFLNFQLQEFNGAELIADEDKKMETELARLTNAEDIKKTLSQAYQLMNDDEQSVIDQLEKVSLALGEIKDYHPDVAKIYDRYDGILMELRDLSSDFEKVADNTEYDGERILELQERQDIERLQKEIAEQEVSLKKRAAALRKKRLSVTEGFEKKVDAMLTQLSMQHARLQVEVQELDQLNSTGIDEVNFLFASNKGSKFLPLKNVASGGELSRLTLCTKSLVADAIPLPTLIFDEIDTGISGDVALRMGRILQELSGRHQVVSITHSPQIAVKADTHYFVYKKEMKDRTMTRVKELTMEERIRAVATMLSGNPPSDSAIENAKELLLAT